MTELLSKETFLEKVFNFEKNKERKFEGDLPCIIESHKTLDHKQYYKIADICQVNFFILI